MNRLLTAIPSCALLCSAPAQTVESICEGSLGVVNEYLDDADRITVLHALNNETNWADSIALDSAYSRTLIRALIAIHNAPGLTAVDTVVDILDIHTIPSPSLRNFYITAYNTHPWMQQLQDGIIPTGYAPLDAYLQQFDITLESYSAGLPGIEDRVVFNTGWNVNTIALSVLELGSLPEIAYGNQNAFAIDGDNIEAEVVDDSVRITFSWGWGDCFNGCVYRRYWEFVVIDCQVTYLGSYGSSLPQGVAVNDRVLMNVVQRFDPLTRRLFISDPSVSDFFVLDNLGRTVLLGSNSRDAIAVDHLPAGVYLSVAVRTGGRHSLRFVIE